MARGFKTFTQYDAMEFPAYEYREYPKMVYVPRKLPNNLPDAAGLDEGNKFRDGNGHEVAVIRNGQWEAVPRGVMCRDEDEERRVLGMLPKPKDPVAEAQEDEKTSLLRLAEQLGVHVDKRWGLERIRTEVQANVSEAA